MTVVHSQVLILCFKYIQPTSFDDIKMFLPFSQKYEPSILLAVGSGTSVLDPEENAYNAWCLNNGFEFIDLEVSPSVSDGRHMLLVYRTIGRYEISL